MMAYMAQSYKVQTAVPKKSSSPWRDPPQLHPHMLLYLRGLLNHGPPNWYSKAHSVLMINQVLYRHSVPRQIRRAIAHSEAT